MKKKQIQQLVTASYKKEELDAEKVNNIASQLDRTEIKEYIKALKSFENKNSVTITLPRLPEEEEKKKFSSLFPEKKIVYNIDPSLLVGVKIKDNDLITEISLKDTLEDMVDYIDQNYD